MSGVPLQNLVIVIQRLLKLSQPGESIGTVVIGPNRLLSREILQGLR